MEEEVDSQEEDIEENASLPDDQTQDSTQGGRGIAGARSGPNIA